jgi:hypothetical protein
MNESLESNEPPSREDATLVFPTPSAPLCDSHLRERISWADYLNETAWHFRRYLEEHDDPEERLARKSLKRFSL